MSTIATLALYKHTVVTTETVSADSSVARDLTYAKRELANVETVDGLLSNARLLRIVTTAFGVGSYGGNDLRKALESEVVPTGTALTATITADVNHFLGLEADGTVSADGGITAVTSATELLDDEALARVFTMAFGLEGYADRPEFLATLLEDDVYDPTSAIQQIDDPDLLEAAKTFQRLMLYAGDLEYSDTYDDLIRDVTNRYGTAMLLESGTAGEGSALEAFDDPALTEMAATLALSASGGTGLADEATVQDILDRYVAALQKQRQAEEDAKAVNYSRAVGAIEKDPATKRDIEYFTQTIGTVETVDDLMKNDRLYRFVMEAFGLESQLGSRALIRKILEGGVADESSMANRMNNRNFKDMATALRIAEDGGATLDDPDAVQAIVDRLVQVRMEKRAGEQDEGVRLALYFQRMAPEVRNWYDVMADTALATVFRTAFNLPDAVATMDVDKQKALYEKKFAFDDMKDPDKLQTLLTRFAANYQVQNGTANTTASAAALTILNASSSASIISIDPALTVMLSQYPRF